VYQYSKGKVFFRAEATTMDAQKVYAAWGDAYIDQLSVCLESTSLWSELTIMKLNDKWRNGYEAFLNHWSNKILDLETMEDKAIDDDTKRIWLTNTLNGQKDMNSAVCHAITTELPLCGMQGLSTTKQVSWNRSYHIVLSTAKMFDSTRSQNAGRPLQNNNASRNNPGKGSGNPNQHDDRNNNGRNNGVSDSAIPPQIMQTIHVLVWL
jgi:hypothetical protein